MHTKAQEASKRISVPHVNGWRLTHDAEWQPTRDFVDKDSTINDEFYNYSKKENIMKHLWEFKTMLSRTTTGGR